MSDAPRQERAIRTRSRILQAAVGCLVEFGYADTTMQRVQDRAEVSRGTLTHHFDSRHSLLAASIRYIAASQLQEIEQYVATGPKPQSVKEVVQLLRPFMSGPLFVAGLELWGAARTDSDLRQELIPAERKLGRHLMTALGSAMSAVDFGMLLSLFRGLAISNALRSSDESASEQLDRWVELVENAEN